MSARAPSSPHVATSGEAVLQPSTLDFRELKSECAVGTVAVTARESVSASADARQTDKPDAPVRNDA